MPLLVRRSWAVFVAAIVVVAAPHGLDAQVFTQPYVGLGYADGFTALLGLNLLKDLTAADEDALVDEGGPILSGFVSAGLRTNDTQVTGLYGLGVVLPTGGAVSSIGPIAFGSVHPWGGGGGLRLAGGFGAGLGWLTAGVIKLEDRSGVRVLANLNLTWAFVCDVTPVC